MAFKNILIVVLCLCMSPERELNSCWKKAAFLPSIFKQTQAFSISPIWKYAVLFDDKLSSHNWSSLYNTDVLWNILSIRSL
jgi:hypothetical protein